jgi:cell division protein FtsL
MATTAQRLQMNAKLIRERDRKVTRDLIRFFLISSALLIPVILCVRQRMEFMRVSYHLRELTRQEKQLQDQHRQLLVERAQLRALDDVERIARQRHGLVGDHQCEIMASWPDAAADPETGVTR